MSDRLHIEPAWSGALRASGLTSFDDFMHVRGGPPASRHRHRETLPVELFRDGDGRVCFLKRVFWIPPKHCIVPLLRLRPPFSQPGREWRACRQLTAAGIPVMRPVAFGERRALGLPRQAFILVEAAPMAHTAEDWLVPGVPKPRPLDRLHRRRLLHELGGLLHRLTSCGFDWPDASAKHVFAAPGGAGDESAWRFCLIDVERMTRRRGRIDAVATLSRFVESLSPMPWSHDDAIDFVGGALGRSWADLRDAAIRREADAERRWLGLAPVEAPRLPDDYVHPRLIDWQRRGGVRIDGRWTRLLAGHQLDSLEGVFACNAGESMSKPGLAGHRERIRLRLVDPAGNERVIYLKRYLNPPLTEQIRRIREAGRHGGTASRERRMIRRLWTLGIPTLDGVAFGEEMHGPWERRSFSMTAAIDGISLEKLAERTGRGEAALTSADRRDIARQLAYLVGRLHRHGLFHRDLYLCHVFLTRNATGRAILRLIDLARMIDRPRRRRRWQIKDLSALHFSTPAELVPRAARLRFLYDYLAALSPPTRERRAKANVRQMAGDVERRTAYMAAREARRRERRAGREVSTAR